MKQKILYVIVMAALGLATFAALAETSAETKDKFSRQSLFKKRATLPSNAVDANVIRVHFPKGYKTPLHTHEGPGPRYVLKGRLKVEDSGETNVFGPGEVFWETGAAMTVENVGGGEAEILIFELAQVKADHAAK